MNLQNYMTVLMRDINEDPDDNEVYQRVLNWLCEINAEICREKGIQGLQVTGSFSATGATETRWIAAIASAHNAKSRIIRFRDSYLLDGTTRYSMNPISFEDYLGKMLSSDSRSKPSQWATMGEDDNANPYVYLYPPPNKETYEFHFFGEASIGRLESSSDIIYPVGSEDVHTMGVRWLQAQFNEDVYNAQNLFQHFWRRLMKFELADHAIPKIYVLGRYAGQYRPSTPRIPEVVIP